MAFDRERKSQLRSQQTATEKEEEKAAAKERMAKLRSQESPNKSQTRKEKENQGHKRRLRELKEDHKTSTKLAQNPKSKSKLNATAKVSNDSSTCFLKYSNNFELGMNG